MAKGFLTFCLFLSGIHCFVWYYNAFLFRAKINRHISETLLLCFSTAFIDSHWLFLSLLLMCFFPFYLRWPELNTSATELCNGTQFFFLNGCAWAMARTLQYAQAAPLNSCGMHCFVLVDVIFFWQILHNHLPLPSCPENLYNVFYCCRPKTFFGRLRSDSFLLIFCSKSLITVLDSSSAGLKTCAFPQTENIINV